MIKQFFPGPWNFEMTIKINMSGSLKSRAEKAVLIGAALKQTFLGRRLSARMNKNLAKSGINITGMWWRSYE